MSGFQINHCSKPDKKVTLPLFPEAEEQGNKYVRLPINIQTLLTMIGSSEIRLRWIYAAWFKRNNNHDFETYVENWIINRCPKSKVTEDNKRRNTWTEWDVVFQF